MFLRVPNVTAFMDNELKCSAQQQAQTNSKSISSSAHKIKKLKPTCIETDQAQSKSSRSSAQQIKEVTRTANGSGQTHSKSKISSKKQINYIKRTPNQTMTAPRNAPDSKNKNRICWTNEQCSTKQNIYGPAERTK